MPPRHLRVVDLPAPFWPSRTRSSPGSTWRSTPATARTSPKLLRRPSTRITAKNSGLNLLERVHGHDKNRRAAHLDLDRVRHEELSGLGQRGHRREVAAALVAVLADDLQRVRHLRVFEAYQERHVALLEESAARGDAGRADALVRQRGDGLVRV